MLVFLICNMQIQMVMNGRGLIGWKFERRIGGKLSFSCERYIRSWNTQRPKWMTDVQPLTSIYLKWVVRSGPQPTLLRGSVHHTRLTLLRCVSFEML